MASDWIRSRYSPGAMQVGIEDVYVTMDYLSQQKTLGDEVVGDAQLMGQVAVPPLKVGPKSAVLNQSPSPRYSAAVEGALDM
jgi:hypothetical protein